MILECILLSASLCHAVKDKPVVVLASIQSVTLITDGITTREIEKTGNYEADPVSRVFIGKYPTWQRMAPAGAGLVIAEMWLSERMKTSRHKWERRFWWLPEAAGIAANSYSIGRNENIAHRHTPIPAGGFIR